MKKTGEDAREKAKRLYTGGNCCCFGGGDRPFHRGLSQNSGGKDDYTAKIEEIFKEHGGVKSGAGYKGLSHYDECVYNYEIKDNGMISIDCSVLGEGRASAVQRDQM